MVLKESIISFLTVQRAEKGAEQPKRSDDEDEDIIDLGKDEDLDFEIKNDGNSEPKVNFPFYLDSNLCYERFRFGHLLLE